MYSIFSWNIDCLILDLKSTKSIKKDFIPKIRHKQVQTAVAFQKWLYHNSNQMLLSVDWEPHWLCKYPWHPVSADHHHLGPIIANGRCGVKCNAQIPTCAAPEDYLLLLLLLDGLPYQQQCPSVFGWLHVCVPDFYQFFNLLL